MAKKKKQNKNNGLVSMDICNDSSPHEGAQAMDTSEENISNVRLSVANRIMKRSAPKRRGQQVRKAKAIEKAISNNEKTQEKVAKNQSKMQRVNTIKSLY